MRIGVTRERAPGETRVAIVPDDVKRLIKKGFDVMVEQGAGQLSSYKDEDYRAAGATMVDNLAAVYDGSDLIAKVHRPAVGKDDELSHLNKNKTVVSLMQSMIHPEETLQIAETGAKTFAMELIPRSTKAQKMDVLSSMANIAGYKAVLLAADHLDKVMPMLMTAAGTMKPARALIIGAGVAGLQAIATAKRLGAIVEAFDTRPAVKEQVESLGGKFVDVPLSDEDRKIAEDAGGYARKLSDAYYERQKEILAERIVASDLVITTAQIFGKPAPILITEQMVKDMHPGSVIVDLAIETGGNCALTVPGEICKKHGVTLIGLLNLPGMVPQHASQMYSRNMIEFILNLEEEANTKPEDRAEESIARASLLSEGGKIVHRLTLDRLAHKKGDQA